MSPPALSNSTAGLARRILSGVRSLRVDSAPRPGAAMVAAMLLCCSAGVRADALSIGARPLWVEHLVIPGDRLREIARRHGVSVQSIVAENELDPERPRLRVGQALRVHALRVPPMRKRITYIVRFGDNWRTIARRHGIEQRKLRRWNRDVPRTFEAGQELTMWVDADVKPVVTAGLGLDVDPSGLPLQPVAAGGQSSGQPVRGRLLAGVRLPDNPRLYTIRRPDFAWGATHTVRNLQLALAKFRQRSDFPGRIIISDMSRRRGRAFGGHRSHQSGRDVDIWLPVKREREVVDGGMQGAAPQGPGEVDWLATWQLIKALVRTGQVQYIFLARSRQRFLYRAARASGEDVRLLGAVMQYPRSSQAAIVRHSAKHYRHLHVRFACAVEDRRCR